MHRGFALAQVHGARKWQKQYSNSGMPNPKSEFNLPHTVLPKYSSTLAQGSCFLLLGPILYKSVGEIQKENLCSWVFCSMEPLRAWEVEGSYGIHEP